MTELNENALKKIDRILHANEYQEMKKQYETYRGQTKLLQQELEDLRKTYANIKHSPQAAAIKMEIEAKERALQDAKERLNILRTEGRKGLGIDPTTYKMGKAREEGLKIGGLTGLGTGALAGLALGNKIWSEA